MDLEETISVLESGEYKIVDTRRLPNNSGSQLILATGQIVNVFDTGTYSVQGRNREPVEQLLSRRQGEVSQIPAGAVSRDVFVVYGHNETAKTQLEAMLRRWDIQPLFLDQLPSEGQTIIEKLERYQRTVRFAVVLATPDDEGHRSGHSDERVFRARQNVVLELGMMLAQLGRSRVAILLKDQDKMERPSDIQGLIYIPFKDDINRECAVQLAKEMNAQGLTIDLRKL